MANIEGPLKGVMAWLTCARDDVGCLCDEGFQRDAGLPASRFQVAPVSALRHLGCQPYCLAGQMRKTNTVSE
ncbi:hypothetical protein QF037_000768 [Streptomyces canus]|uniref:hypothetical protein n=1 Tax=Streptomyces canus TaxID=58343 RepID=UPI002783FEED|nr:hypothetical protein [Streptomyces canus]MDQ0596423.1 hypothetical protein [Streptomyces canus]